MYAEKIQKAIEKAEDEHFNGNNEAAEMLEMEAREIAREALERVPKRHDAAAASCASAVV